MEACHGDKLSLPRSSGHGISPTMRLLFWILTASTAIFIPAFLASWLGASAHISPQVLDRSMLFSFVAGVILMIWMLASCIRDKSLSSAERLRWELLLAIGGPITAIVFLYRSTMTSSKATA